MRKDFESLRQLYLDMYLHTPGKVTVLQRAFRLEHNVPRRTIERWRKEAGLSARMRNKSLRNEQYAHARSLIEQGATCLAAAQACGIAERTLYNWLSEEGYRFANGRHGGLLDIKRGKQKQVIDSLRQGICYDDIAKSIGISVDTVQKWHYAYMNGTLDITFIAETSHKVGRGQRISWHERALIAYLLKKKHSPTEIARELGRSQSTIHREIRRNSTLDGRYDAKVAQERASRNLRRPRSGKLETNPLLRRLVKDGLNARWSPQQIAGFLARVGNKREDVYVSHETIYQALYIQGKGALRHELTVEKALRSGRTGRKPQSKLPRRTNRSWIGDDYRISNRPASVNDRAVPGHWEGDLVIGQNRANALITCVERSTRYTLIRKLDTHDAVSTTDRLIEMFSGLMRNVTKTLTWDQGVEMADADRFALARGIPVYYCDPHSPWQRPTNENTNGLVRDFLPKGSDFSDLTDEQIQEIEDLLNDRPRKVLGFYTPREKMMELFT